MGTKRSSRFARKGVDSTLVALRFALPGVSQSTCSAMWRGVVSTPSGGERDLGSSQGAPPTPDAHVNTLEQRAPLRLLRRSMRRAGEDAKGT
jgi:hypothetical protein